MCRFDRCISISWSMYVYFDVFIVYTLFAGLFTKLISIFVGLLIIMLLSLTAFVRFSLKKLLACLLSVNNQNVIKMSDGHRNVVIR